MRSVERDDAQVDMKLDANLNLEHAPADLGQCELVLVVRLGHVHNVLAKRWMQLERDLLDQMTDIYTIKSAFQTNKCGPLVHI